MYNLDDAFSLAHIATALIIIAFVLVVTVLRKNLDKK
jgi:hypothetical protein